MTTPATSIGTNAETPAPATAMARSVWKSKYAERHRLERIRGFPEGIHPPRRVRIYRRQNYYMLQWWDRAEKRTLSRRIDGDLIEAIAAARKIDEKLASHRTAGIKSEKVTFDDAAQKFVADLERRADAGEIDPNTILRYASALTHLLAFAEQPHVARRWPYVGRIDRNFQLTFAAHLQGVQITPNGHAHARRRPLKSHNYIQDVVRALLEWACDPQRGGLLPGDFRNPFVRRARESRTIAADLLEEPDVSLPMAVDLVNACDEFQLAIFSTLLLFGLRPGELGWVFREDLEQTWLRVRCHAELDYFTKGRRDKRFPALDCLVPLWKAQGSGETAGLLYRPRRVVQGRAPGPLADSSLSKLVEHYQQRCLALGQAGARQRRQIRNQLLKEAGQLTYDHIQGEFRQLKQQLGWPRQATLKDLRHLFATCLENAGIPEFFRRYLMGQSVGNAPIVAYTHLTGVALREQFHKAVDTQFKPIVEAIAAQSRRLAEMGRPFDS